MINDHDLTKGSIVRNLVILALPIMFSNFIQTLYNLTDTYFLGKLGSEAKNAVSVTGMAFPLVFFILSFGFGFVIAGTSLTAQYKGADKLKEINKLVGQYILIVGALCFVFVGAGLLFLKPVLQIMHTPAEIFEMAETYISYIFSSMAFMLIFLAYQSISHGLGNTLKPMIIQLISVGINILLDPLLIFGFSFVPKMGIEGAAIATFSSRILAAFLAIFYFYKDFKSFIPDRKDLKPDFVLVKKILSISIPASLAQSVTSFGFLFLQGFINSFGTIVITTQSIGNRITGFFMMPAMGISNALASVVGQNLGAGKIDRAKMSIHLTFLLVGIIMFFGCTLVFTFGEELIRFFIDDPEVISIGKRMFKITSIASFIFGIQFVFNGVFNGSGHTKPAMIFNVSRLWFIRIPCVFLLSGRILEYDFVKKISFIKQFTLLVSKPLSNEPYFALWWSMIISNIIATIIAWVIYRSGKWQKAKIFD